MTQALIDPATGAYLAQPFHVLDPLAPGGVREFERRPAWIATISAGRKVPAKTKDGRDITIPKASDDREFYVHEDVEGRAAGLLGELKAQPLGGGTFVSTAPHRLTVAFASNDLGEILSQRFTLRSATRLDAYGDARSLTQIVREGQGNETKVRHVTHYPGSTEYADLVRQCKAETTVLFALARWTGPASCEVRFPDDAYGWYRLRFTSRWSTQAILGKLTEIQTRVTGTPTNPGNVAGIPFDLFLTRMTVPGPDGSNRNIPVWQLEFRPPHQVTLSSGNMQRLLGAGLQEGAKLRLAAPASLREDAIFDADDPTEDAMAALASASPRCDARQWEARWFALVKGTPLHDADGRAAFVERYTSEHYEPGAAWTTSLREFLETATDAEAAAFYAATIDELGGSVDGPAVIDGEYAEVAGGEDATPPEPVMASEQMLADYGQLMLHAARRGWDLAPWEVSAPIAEADLTAKGKTLKNRLSASLDAG